MNVNIDLTDILSVINPSFHFLLYESHRIVMCRGGAGSSKSFSIIQALIYFILRDFDKPFSHKFLCLRKTSPAARKSLFPLIKHIISEWGIDSIVKVNNTEMSFTFVNGSEIIVNGLDDESKLKSIFGVTKIFLEEVTDFKEQDYKQANLRLRGILPVKFQVIGAFNPVSNLSWVYNTFFNNSNNDNILTHHSTYKDNYYLDSEYKETLERLIEQDENFYKIYTLGEWGSLDGLIYNNWTIIDEWVEPEGDTVYGIDPGYVHNTAITRVGEYRDGFIIDELLYEPKLTVSDIIAKLSDIVEKDRYMYMDNSRPEGIEEIWRAGYNCHPATKGPNSVKEGIDFIKGKKLYITKRSSNLIDEIKTYCWAKDKDGNSIEAPIKFNDDGCDSFRYSIFSHFFNKVEGFFLVPK